MLAFPRLARTATNAVFLLDTGAAFSVVHPKDMLSLGIDVLEAFNGRPSVGGRGIGGRAEYFEEEARLSFQHVDGVQVDYTLPVYVALPTPDNTDYPSFLGMDFLSNFRFTMHFERGLVELQ